MELHETCIIYNIAAIVLILNTYFNDIIVLVYC